LKEKKIITLGELKKSGYQSKSIKDELRDNLRENIKNGITSFTGVWGYEICLVRMTLPDGSKQRKYSI